VPFKGGETPTHSTQPLKPKSGSIQIASLILRQLVPSNPGDCSAVIIAVGS
jgi:hypothetical protein